MIYNSTLKNIAKNAPIEGNTKSSAVNDPLIIEVGKNVAFLKAKSEIFMGNAQTESSGIENQGFIDSLNGKISQLRNEAIKNAQSPFGKDATPDVYVEPSYEAGLSPALPLTKNVVLFI